MIIDSHVHAWAARPYYPRRFTTCRQSLEVLRTHCAFIPEANKAWILGKNLESLMKTP